MEYPPPPLFMEARYAPRFLRADSSWLPAREVQYEDGLTVVTCGNGLVWFRAQEGWRNYDKEQWAWKLFAVVTDRNTQRLWVPKLLSSDGQRRARNKPTASLSQTSTFANIIAHRLFELVRSYGDRALCRTGRLVCRDWAKQCPVRVEKYSNWKVEEGIVWHQIETGWRRLPSCHWAWTLRPFSNEWWVEPRCHQQWRPILVDSKNVIEAIDKYRSISPSGAAKRSAISTTIMLPPELFKHICNAANQESSSSRLVSRYWNRQCTPLVFKQVDAQKSPERIRALRKWCSDPVFMQHLRAIVNIPRYDKDSRFPWIHLLTQTSATTGSKWNHAIRITVRGPFTGGHQTIRSVHFSLPRPLPPSLSRGIKKLHVRNIHFRRLEDLVHMACELPDLERLGCFYSGFQELPMQLPRRRPRTDRNRLYAIDIWSCEASLEEISTYASVVLTLYLSVYSAASFFSEDETAVLSALFRLLHRLPAEPTVRYTYNPQDHSRTIVLGEWICHNKSRHIKSPEILMLRISQDAIHNRPRLDVVVDCRFVDADHEGYTDRWTQFGLELSKINTLMRNARFVFGFADRGHMVRFAETILAKEISSVNGLATVRYCVYDKEAASIDVQYCCGLEHKGGWRQASLDSDELTGPAKNDLAAVYT